MPRFFILTVAVLVLASCANDPEPVGTGMGTDDFSRSPCACKEIDQAPVDSEYLRRLKRRLKDHGHPV